MLECMLLTSSLQMKQQANARVVLFVWFTSISWLCYNACGLCVDRCVSYHKVIDPGTMFSNHGDSRERHPDSVKVLVLSSCLPSYSQQPAPHVNSFISRMQLHYRLQTHHELAKVSPFLSQSIHDFEHPISAVVRAVQQNMDVNILVPHPRLPQLPTTESNERSSRTDKRLRTFSEQLKSVLNRIERLAFGGVVSSNPSETLAAEYQYLTGKIKFLEHQVKTLEVEKASQISHTDTDLKQFRTCVRWLGRRVHSAKTDTLEEFYSVVLPTPPSQSDTKEVHSISYNEYSLNVSELVGEDDLLRWKWLVDTCGDSVPWLSDSLSQDDMQNNNGNKSIVDDRHLSQ